MVKDIDVTIVIGANYGDEGKGRMTDYFANEAIKELKETIVVCSNGGAQRGHTVQLYNGYKHIFHHFGSGTLAGADTYLPQSFIVNPMIFMKEYNELLNSPLGRDMNFWPKIFVNPDCLVSTPFDMINNQIIEENRTQKHGSCGVGIWETILRDGIRLYTMTEMTDEMLFKYLKWVRDTYSSKRLNDKKIDSISAEWKDIYYNDQLIHNYIQDFRAFCKIIHFKTDSMLCEYDKIIFENGQGLLIDENKDPVYSTPSHTGLDWPLYILNNLLSIYIDIKFNIEICYVTRSYYTRHGNGYLMYECDAKDISGLDLNTETNHFNNNQGKFRYGKLDIDAFSERLKNYNAVQIYGRNNIDSLSVAITHCDELLPIPTTSLILRNAKFNKLYKSFGPGTNNTIVKELL